MARDWDRVWNDARIKIDGDSNRFLSVRVYYLLGGGHCRRGYYLSVTPIVVEDRGNVRLNSYCPSDGVMFLLKEVNRRSTKAEASACDIAKKVLDAVVDRVCEKNGISRDRLGDLVFD